MTQLDLESVRNFISERASLAVESRNAYWVHGASELRNINCSGSDDFCFDCCNAKVAEIVAKFPVESELAGISVDGGFDTDHDSPPYCATCGCRLFGNLTEYGVEEELLALTTDCAPRFDDIEGWQSMYLATINTDDNDPIWSAIGGVVTAARPA